jgi:hypothetical protein
MDDETRERLRQVERELRRGNAVKWLVITLWVAVMVIGTAMSIGGGGDAPQVDCDPVAYQPVC